jgi:hypothetical protein
MNPPLSFSNALTELKTLTSQTNNFTFTDDELTQALTEAWNNTYVCNKVTDASLSFTSGTYQYTIPADMTVVTAIWVQFASDQPKSQLDRAMYHFPDNSTIEFIGNVDSWLDTGLTLYLIGRYKLTTTDSLTTEALVNYVISLAAYYLLKRLALKAALQFLKNDTTIGEIIQLRNAYQSDMLMAKQSLQREFESV